MKGDMPESRLLASVDLAENTTMTPAPMLHAPQRCRGAAEQPVFMIAPRCEAKICRPSNQPCASPFACAAKVSAGTPLAGRRGAARTVRVMRDAAPPAALQRTRCSSVSCPQRCAVVPVGRRYREQVFAAVALQRCKCRRIPTSVPANTAPDDRDSCSTSGARRSKRASVL